MEEGENKFIYVEFQTFCETRRGNTLTQRRVHDIATVYISLQEGIYRHIAKKKTGYVYYFQVYEWTGADRGRKGSKRRIYNE